MILGLLAMIVGRFGGEVNEPIVFIAYLLLLFGVVLSFIALFKREKGIMKAIPVVLFFTVLFYIAWTEPLLFLHMMAWLKSVV